MLFFDGVLLGCLVGILSHKLYQMAFSIYIEDIHAESRFVIITYIEGFSRKLLLLPRKMNKFFNPVTNVFMVTEDEREFHVTQDNSILYTLKASDVGAKEFIVEIPEEDKYVSIQDLRCLND